MQSFRFLVDVNLPKFFQFFNSPDFVHVVDLDRSLADEQVWEYAVEHDLVILTKDTDFYFKCLVVIPSPKVVYFKVGNLRLKELHQFFTKHWEQILEKLPQSQLLLVEQDSITIVLAKE